MKPANPSVQDDNMSLDQYVRELGALPKTLKMINLWARVMHGLESTEESAAWFIDYCRRNGGLLSIRSDDKTGGQYQRFQDGMATCTSFLRKSIMDGQTDGQARNPSQRASRSKSGLATSISARRFSQSTTRAHI